ncbi:MAG: SRPBCC family protein [Rubrobacteraceae bacterium]
MSLGASVFVPVPAARLYEVLLDVKNFPRWAPAVRRVEVLEGGPGSGMISEWELSILGVRKRVLSLLETADSSERLRWTYEGPIQGWGACVLRERGDGTLADFSTELHVAEPVLERLLQRLPVSGLATSQLKRSLAGLGRMVSGERDVNRVVVGPQQIAA